MKVCIFGDRTCEDYQVLLKAIAASKMTITEVVNGEAKGSDALGKRFAEENNIPLRNFPADWKDCSVPGAVVRNNAYGSYNAKAGSDRNQQMAEYCDAGIGLQPYGPSVGSQDMVKRLEKLNKPVFVYGGESKEKYEF